MLVSSGDDTILEQINKQLNRLMLDVIRGHRFQGVEIIDREMEAVKVAIDGRTRPELDSIVAAFPRPRGGLSDATQSAIELTGDEEKVKAFIALVRPLGIKEIVRSGKIAMARAVQPSDNHNRRPAQKAGEQS